MKHNSNLKKHAKVNTDKKKLIATTVLTTALEIAGVSVVSNVNADNVTSSSTNAGSSSTSKVTNSSVESSNTVALRSSSVKQSSAKATSATSSSAVRSSAKATSATSSSAVQSSAKATSATSSSAVQSSAKTTSATSNSAVQSSAKTTSATSNSTAKASSKSNQEYVTVPNRSLGMDVSDYQSNGIIDQMKNQGVKFVIVKVSEGLSNGGAVNAGTKIKDAENDGMAVLGYHYAHFGANSDQAVREAIHAAANAKYYGLPEGSYLACDYEQFASGSVANNTNAVITFMGKVKQLGYNPLLYSSASYLKEHLNTEEIVSKFGPCLWVASWQPSGNNPNFRYFPSMDGVVIWQYTDKLDGKSLDGDINVLPLTLKSNGSVANSSSESNGSEHRGANRKVGFTQKGEYTGVVKTTRGSVKGSAAVKGARSENTIHFTSEAPVRFSAKSEKINNEKLPQMGDESSKATEAGEIGLAFASILAGLGFGYKRRH